MCEFSAKTSKKYSLWTLCGIQIWWFIGRGQNLHIWLSLLFSKTVAKWGFSFWQPQFAGAPVYFLFAALTSPSSENRPEELFDKNAFVSGSKIDQFFTQRLVKCKIVVHTTLSLTSINKFIKIFQPIYQNIWPQKWPWLYLLFLYISHEIHQSSHYQSGCPGWR